MLTTTAMKEWLMDLKNICQFSVTLTPRLEKRISQDYSMQDLEIALTLVEKLPPDGRQNAQFIFTLLDRAQFQRRGGAGLPDKYNEPEAYNALQSKYSTYIAMRGQVAPHEVPGTLAELHKGTYDNMLNNYLDSIVFSGTKEFGDDWRACKAHHEALTAPLRDKRPGDNIDGMLTSLIDGVCKPLPYDKNEREPGVYVPSNRRHFDVDE